MNTVPCLTGARLKNGASVKTNSNFLAQNDHLKPKLSL